MFLNGEFIPLSRNVAGLDIGGANLKAAHVDGQAVSHPFAIWQHPQRLSQELNNLLNQLPQADRLAVTMTAELADCFETKAEGVDHILTSVEEVANGRPIEVWQTVGEFVSPELARETPLLTAAANWHALATWIGRTAPEGVSLMIDIGSTTTDIIPLLNGCPIPEGRTDFERLCAGELVYTGVRRTPLIALTKSLKIREQECFLAAELFASTLDLHLISGEIEENHDDLETANGKSATREAALDRIARSFCCDRQEMTDAEIEQISQELIEHQKRMIRLSIQQVLVRQTSECQSLFLSGEGAFLGQKICQTDSLGKKDACRILLRAPQTGELGESTIYAEIEGVENTTRRIRARHNEWTNLQVIPSQ